MVDNTQVSQILREVVRACFIFYPIIYILGTEYILLSILFRVRMCVVVVAAVVDCSWTLIGISFDF